MDKGTKLRTLLAIASVINSGAIATGIAEFQNPAVDTVYKILSFAATAVILFVNTYYNNNYTEAGQIGTAITREVKNNPDFVPYVELDETDDDEDDPDEDEECDEVIDPYEGDESGEVEQK